MQPSTASQSALTDLGKAFVPFLQALVTIAVDTAKEHAKGNEGPTFIDARSSEGLGLSRKTFLRLARQGAFPTHRAGKTILADRDAVIAYIRAQNGAKPRAARVPFEAPTKDVNEMTPAEILALPTGKGK